MKYYYLTICFFVPLLGISQTKNALSFNTGLEAGWHTVKEELRYNGSNVDDHYYIPMTVYFRSDAHFSFTDWLSAGLLFRTGKYYRNANLTGTTDNNTYDLSVGIRMYPINRERFTMYLGLYGGMSGLHITHVESGITESGKWRGGNFTSDVGFNCFFSAHFGVNYSVGYTYHFLDLKSYNISSGNSDMTGWKDTFTANGFHSTIGICYRFLGN